MDLVTLEEGNIKECSNFLRQAIGLNKESLLIQENYLRWKYLSPEGNDNLCLFFKNKNEFCAVVAGMVWDYIIEGKRVRVCFPVDWFSNPGNTFKGAGKKILRAIMERFPVSVAVGGTDICFNPQLAVGFVDVGDVYPMWILRSDPKRLRRVIKRALVWFAHPCKMSQGSNLGKHFLRTSGVSFKDEQQGNEALQAFQGRQLFSEGVPRESLLKKWSYYRNQPCNPCRIVTVNLRGKASYMLVCEFNDSRKDMYGLADALACREHSTEDILSAFASLVSLRGKKDAFFMTNKLDIIDAADSLGYIVQKKIRTQYFSLPGEPVCETIFSFPSVSLLSYDELNYRIGKGDVLGQCCR